MFTLHPQLQNDTLALGESELNLLLLINDSQYPWALLVPKRANIKEAFQLSLEEQLQLQRESCQLSAQLHTLFSADKINVAALGNQVPQLHLHHIVRHTSDPAWPNPIWGQAPLQPYTDTLYQERLALLANSPLNTLFTFR